MNLTFLTGKMLNAKGVSVAYAAIQAEDPKSVYTVHLTAEGKVVKTFNARYVSAAPSTLPTGPAIDNWFQGSRHLFQSLLDTQPGTTEYRRRWSELRAKVSSVELR